MQKITLNVYLVTIKLPKNPEHDSKHKREAPCPVSAFCTDVTGEHHTQLVFSGSQVQDLREEHHVTRVELTSMTIEIDSPLNITVYEGEDK